MDNKIDINKYKSLLENIKQEVLNAQYKAIYAVNKELMFMYWHIGKIILENTQWGNKFIDNLSMDLKMEFPEIKGFSVRNLKYMRKFAEEYPDFEFVQEVLAQITWYHNIILMDKIGNIEERKWYIKEIVKNGWFCYVTVTSRNGEKISLASQFQKYWLSRVNHLFFRASKPFRRTNPDFFTKNGKKSNFGPFSSSPVNAGCSRYPVVYVSLISSIQAC